MGLKQIIKQQRILGSGVIQRDMDLPSVPLIYSIKYNVGKRTHSVQFFRNAKWRSLLKCCMPSYNKTTIPTVLIVKFYVPPPDNVRIKKADLKSESVPATMAFELCDYLLSFLEILHHVLINSYRQFVKIDMEKYYSDNPRTVFKFMKWDHYVHLKNNNTLHTAAEGERAYRQIRALQSEQPWDVPSPRICKKTRRKKWPIGFPFGRPPPGDMPLQDTSTQGPPAETPQATAPAPT